MSHALDLSNGDTDVESRLKKKEGKRRKKSTGFPSVVCTAGTRCCGYGGCSYDGLGYGHRSMANSPWLKSSAMQETLLSTLGGLA